MRYRTKGRTWAWVEYLFLVLWLAVRRVPALLRPYLARSGSNDHFSNATGRLSAENSIRGARNASSYMPRCDYLISTSSRDARLQAFHVDELAACRLDHVAQRLLAITAHAGRHERDVHPARIRAFARVVALADDLVERREALTRPQREFKRRLGDDLNVAGTALGVLAGADPACGLILQMYGSTAWLTSSQFRYL